jgi:hypothetical protein
MSEQAKHRGPSDTSEIAGLVEKIQGPDAVVSKRVGRTLLSSRRALAAYGLAAAAFATGAFGMFYENQDKPPRTEVQREPGPARTVVVTMSPEAPTPSAEQPSPTFMGAAPSATDNSLSPSPRRSQAATTTPSPSPSASSRPSASPSPTPEQICRPVRAGDLAVCVANAADSSDLYAYSYPNKNRPHAFALTNNMQIMPECATQDGLWILGDDEAANAAGYMMRRIFSGNVGAVPTCD